MNCFVIKAQQKHFMYVQSEDKQPFAIVLNGKVYSSSDYGYIIIPKLTDGTYNFTVSFPMNKFPDQAFTCSVNKKDMGFTLKNGNEGWALMNMQTQKAIMNNTADVAQKSAFGNMLSDAVNDSGLTKTNLPATPPADKSAEVAAASIVVLAADSATTNNTGFITDSITQLEKISESKLDTGTSMLFVDKTQNGADTISVFIPSENEKTDLAGDQKSSSENTTTNSQNANPVLIAPVVVNNAAQNNVPADSEHVAQNDTTEVIPDTTAHVASNPFYKPDQNNNSLAVSSAAIQAGELAIPGVSNAVKQDCGNMISDDDLNKLKRKMFVQDNTNDMIQYAIKYLNKKCITTEQVKTLGSLFSSDDGRYSLYDALYNNVYDYGNYPGLASQIVDPYYRKRFAALLR